MKNISTQAARLKVAREEAGFSDATEAATHFGFPIVAYRSHENGIRGIKPTVAKKYAKAYKVSSGWLSTGDGPMRGLGIESDIMALPKDLSDEILKTVRMIIDAAKIKGRIS